jgi:hypothetical protein
MLLKSVLIATFFFLFGCSSQLVVALPTCSEMNWFEKGRQDGLQGQPSNNWIMHSRECQKMEQAEIQNYLDGWNHGLSMFCTEKHGYILAKSGEPYKKTCPETYEEAFLKGYQQGLQIFLIEKETTQLTAQLESMQRELKKSDASVGNKQQLRKEIEVLNQKRSGNLKTLEKYNNSFSR